MWQKPGIARFLPAFRSGACHGRFHQKLCPGMLRSCAKPEASMTLSVIETTDHASPMRKLLPLWVGVFIYGLFVLAGNRLLIDPDTLWQVTLGQWIIDHRAVPETDVFSFTMRGQPWISTQWLAQVLYAKSFAVAGWSGPVVLAASALAATYALLAKFLSRRLSESHTLVFVAGALALGMPHALARPHVLALPFMVLWFGSLISAADRRGVPPFWSVIWMALWANLHGGFIFGLVLVAPVALDAVLNVEAKARLPLALRWAMFGLAALAAGCCTPYGWNSLLASQKILELGAVLPLIREWQAADFSSIGALEVCLLLGLGLALWRGVTLPPMRIVLLLGLIHMALAQDRAAEILGLLAPLVVALPLAREIGGVESSNPAAAAPTPNGLLIGAVIATLVAGTLAYTSVHRFAPHMLGSPSVAVAEFKKLNLTRVFNDYDFGGYLISNGIPTFIDGRTELYGEKFFIDHNNAAMLLEPDALFRLLDEYKIEAVLLRTTRPGSKLLDHVDGWQKVYSDDVATLHVRVPGAAHTAEPPVK
jgi:hypothetical protein